MVEMNSKEYNLSETLKSADTMTARAGGAEAGLKLLTDAQEQFCKMSPEERTTFGNKMKEMHATDSIRSFWQFQEEGQTKAISFNQYADIYLGGVFISTAKCE